MTACLTLFVSHTFLATAPALAQVLPGEVVFLGNPASDGAAVMKADAVGNRSIVSQFGVRGTGADFKSATGGIAVGPDSMLYITGMASGEQTSVFRINPATGDRTVISSSTVGTGPELRGDADIVVDSSGQIFATSFSNNTLVQVDPVTGNRTLISGAARGTGPAFFGPLGLTRTSSGDFYAFITNAPTNDVIYFIDFETGNRSIVSGGGVGGGTSFQDVGTDVVMLPDGDLASGDFERILRINPVNGNRTVLSSNNVGTGPAIDSLSFEWLTLDSDGLIVGTVPTQGIFRINPTTGDRTLVTGDGFGGGVDVSVYREAIEFQPVPEPSTLCLAAMGLLASGFYRIRRATQSHFESCR